MDGWQRNHEQMERNILTHCRPDRSGSFILGDIVFFFYSSAMDFAVLYCTVLYHLRFCFYSIVKKTNDLAASRKADARERSHRGSTVYRFRLHQ